MFQIAKYCELTALSEEYVVSNINLTGSAAKENNGLAILLVAIRQTRTVSLFLLGYLKIPSCVLWHVLAWMGTDLF